jgi:hypothetical protein
MFLNAVHVGKSTWHQAMLRFSKSCLAKWRSQHRRLLALAVLLVSLLSNSSFAFADKHLSSSTALTTSSPIWVFTGLARGPSQLREYGVSEEEIDRLYRTPRQIEGVVHYGGSQQPKSFDKLLSTTPMIVIWIVLTLFASCVVLIARGFFGYISRRPEIDSNTPSMLDAQSADEVPKAVSLDQSNPYAVHASRDPWRESLWSKLSLIGLTLIFASVVIACLVHGAYEKQSTDAQKTTQHYTH